MPKNVPSRKSVSTRETDPAAGPDSVTGTGGASIKRNNRQPPWEKEAVQNESSSFGDWLRRQREMREISLRDIADRTKISLRYLEAMENDRFDLLPAAVFAKGFLREYARYVGLSPDDVVNHYLSVNHPEEQEAGAKDDTKVRSKPRPMDQGQPSVRRNWSSGLLLALVAFVLLVLVALAVWYVDRHHAQPAASREGQVTPSVVVPPAPAPKPAAAPSAPQPSAPLQVSLDFTQDCWVEAVIDGKNRTSELRVQGEALQLEAEKSIVLTLGNAGAVEVQVNGYPLDLGKKKGDVVHDLLIDLNTVQALKAKKETR